MDHFKKLKLRNNTRRTWWYRRCMNGIALRSLNVAQFLRARIFMQVRILKPRTAVRSNMRTRVMRYGMSGMGKLVRNAATHRARQEDEGGS